MFWNDTKATKDAAEKEVCTSWPLKREIHLYKVDFSSNLFEKLLRNYFFLYILAIHSEALVICNYHSPCKLECSIKCRVHLKAAVFFRNVCCTFSQAFLYLNVSGKAPDAKQTFLRLIIWVMRCYAAALTQLAALFSTALQTHTHTLKSDR